MKSNMRPLTEDERQSCEKGVLLKQDRIAWLKYQLKYYDLMLGEGLYLNYLRTIKEYKQQQREYENELAGEENIIKELERQIKEGVEIKKIEEVKPIEQVEEEAEKGMGYVG